MKFFIYTIFSILVLGLWFTGLFYVCLDSWKYDNFFEDKVIVDKQQQDTIDKQEEASSVKVDEKSDQEVLKPVIVDSVEEQKQDDKATKQNEVSLPEDVKISNIPETKKEPVIDSDSLKLKGVPFYVQAPFVNWDDPIYQNACEEASVLMVMDWINGTKMGLQGVNDTIAEIAVWEKEFFGTSLDTSILDTFSIIKEYFEYTKLEMMRNVSVQNMIDALEKGYIMIAPANGRYLKNPHYTPPGPDNHMIVIIGYDKTKKMFITHDPGTRYGANFYYHEDVLLESIQDYPTGDHGVRQSISRAVIIIKP